MTSAVSEPSGEPRDEGDRAADLAETERRIALRNLRERADIGEDQWIDAEGRVRCLWCEEPLEPERLAAEPAAVRHGCCEEDFGKWLRRNG